MEVTGKEANKEDFDILYILKGIKNGVLDIINSLVSLIHFTIKNFFIFFIFIAIGAGLGFLIYLGKKPYYKTEFTVSHIRFENGFCTEMINNLNSYVEGGNNEELAKVLQIDPKLANEIKCISYKPFNEHIQKLYADSVTTIIPFKVELEVYDNKILPVLQTGILNYLESNEYVLKVKKIEKESLDLVAKKIEEEIAEIDSLKRIVDHSIIPRSTGTGVILGEAIEPVLIYKRALDTYEKLMAINKKQALNNSFQLMIGYTAKNSTAGWGSRTFLVVGMFLGYLAALLFFWIKNGGLSGSVRSKD